MAEVISVIACFLLVAINEAAHSMIRPLPGPRSKVRAWDIDPLIEKPERKL